MAKNNESKRKKKKEKEPWSSKKKIIVSVVIVVVAIIGAFIWKAGSVASQITSSDGGLLSGIAKSLPTAKDRLKMTEDGRINIALMGMRGKNVPGGGLLADTIMVLTIKPAENKASLISVPRDLYVTLPTGGQQKINAAYHYGEEQGEGGGLSAMKEVLGTITGQPIHYAASINFAGFTELIDNLGGIDITLAESFDEPMQFNEERVCDPNVFTKPSGNYETKIDHRGKVVAQYPKCFNPDVECGGDFSLPSGTQVMSGETALCYARSRVTSSDFDRAHRQQEVLKAVQEKALSVGVLTSITTLTDMMTTLGDNLRTDMELWEMKKFLEIYQGLENVNTQQKVLENSEEGLLYSPDNMDGYYLLPRGENYDHIHALFATLP